VESSLPYTIRTRLSRLMEPIAADMRRQALITAEHVQEEDGCRVHLAMSDGIGCIFDLRLLCARRAEPLLDRPGRGHHRHGYVADPEIPQDL